MPAIPDQAAKANVLKPSLVWQLYASSTKQSWYRCVERLRTAVDSSVHVPMVRIGYMRIGGHCQREDGSGCEVHGVDRSSRRASTKTCFRGPTCIAENMPMVSPTENGCLRHSVWDAECVDERRFHVCGNWLLPKGWRDRKCNLVETLRKQRGVLGLKSLFMAICSIFAK